MGTYTAGLWCRRHSVLKGLIKASAPDETVAGCLTTTAAPGTAATLSGNTMAVGQTAISTADCTSGTQVCATARQHLQLLMQVHLFCDSFSAKKLSISSMVPF